MLLCVSIAGGCMLPRVLWDEMLDALDAVSPLVDDVRPGLAFLDMHGIAGATQAHIAQATWRAGTLWMLDACRGGDE